MRYRCLSLALALPLSLAVHAAADDDAIAARLRDAALAGSGAYALTEALTTEVGARLAGSPSDSRAADWAQARFRALGYDKVWREAVRIPLWQRRHERAEVLGEHAQPLLVTALGHTVGSNGPLEAEVVELADLDALKAVSDDRLRGKIVFLSYRMQRARDGAGYSKAADGRADGPNEAAKRGARALLIRSVGTDSHRFPHTGNARRPGEAHPGLEPIPAAALSNPDADQLQRLLARGKPVRLRLDLDVGFAGETTTWNVIGEVTGHDPQAGIVVIGGHLDSWDLGTGAIDDASGVAITMDAGARIAALKQRPRRSLRVIAFGAEEPGLLGAKGYARDNAALLPQHVIGLESDFGAGRIYALRAGVAAAAWPEIERLGELLAPLGIAVERDAGGPGPDIIPLHEQGVPWAQLAQDGSDYFDYHHTADDTLDKIDPKALDQQVAAYAALSWLLLQGAVDFRPAPPAKP